MIIYLDAVWMLNFLLDAMLLLLTQALCREVTKKWRIVFGAFIASLLVPITVYFPDSFIVGVFGKALYSIGIIWSTFGVRNLYRTLKLLFVFYFSTFSIGGGLLAVHYVIQNPISISGSSVLTFNAGYGDPVSWVFVVIGFPIIWWFTKNRMDKHATEKIRYEQLCMVAIQLNNQTFTTKGYIDSGNQLTDPITKKPVVICDESFLRNWFSETEWILLKSSYESLDFEQLPKKWERFIQIVPYQGVKGKSEFLFTLRPERLMVYHGEQKLVATNVLIGIQFAELVRDGSYHCLLQPQIIKLAAISTA
ncbi:sigma-E processing peptidase SpoIIGA [Oceanobacillus kapialis]|uniref:Sporulation sigma-E factor-processing peptidase n=1 Tax=Oceanobacillus kapialis TaxID=481353 RepID=A0ABW5PYL1_9BACI